MQDGLSWECKTCKSALNAARIRRLKNNPPTIPFQSKLCPICKLDLHVDMFYRGRDGAYGLNSVCKPCCRISSLERIRKVPIEIQRQRANKYAATPRGKIAHRKAMKKFLVEKREQYLLLHRLSEHRRRAAKRKTSSIIVTRQDWQDILTSYKSSCAYCGRQDRQMIMEHVLPLSRGGKHTKDNIVPACQQCNLKKYTKALQLF